MFEHRRGDHNVDVAVGERHDVWVIQDDVDAWSRRHVDTDVLVIGLCVIPEGAVDIHGADIKDAPVARPPVMVQK